MRAYAASGQAPPGELAIVILSAFLGAAALTARQERGGGLPLLQGPVDRYRAKLVSTVLLIEVLSCIMFQRASAVGFLSLTIAALSGTGLLSAMYFSRSRLGRQYTQRAWIGACLVVLAGLVAVPLRAPFLGGFGPTRGALFGTAAAALAGVSLVAKEALLKGGSADASKPSFRPLDSWTVALITCIAQLVTLLPSLERGVLPAAPPAGMGLPFLSYVVANGAMRLSLMKALREAQAPSVQLVHTLGLHLGAALSSLPGMPVHVALGLAASIYGAGLASGIFGLPLPARSGSEATSAPVLAKPLAPPLVTPTAEAIPAPALATSAATLEPAGFETEAVSSAEEAGKLERELDREAVELEAGKLERELDREAVELTRELEQERQHRKAVERARELQAEQAEQQLAEDAAGVAAWSTEEFPPGLYSTIRPVDVRIGPRLASKKITSLLPGASIEVREVQLRVEDKGLGTDDKWRWLWGRTATAQGGWIPMVCTEGKQTWVERMAPLTRWLVDNGKLNASTAGLGYRRSQSMPEVVDDVQLWGSVVEGTVVESGEWLKVGQRFLPMRVNGAEVLRRLSPADAPRRRATAQRRAADAAAAAALATKRAAAARAAADEAAARVAASTPAAKQPPPAAAAAAGGQEFNLEVQLAAGAAALGLAAGGGGAALVAGALAVFVAAASKKGKE